MDWEESSPLALANPPESFFERLSEEDEIALFAEGRKTGIDDDGRITGVFYEEGVCVVAASGPGQCWSPSPSASEYGITYQSVSQVTASTGEVTSLKVGGLVHTHADPMANPEEVADHYNDPTAIRAVYRAFDVPGLGGYVTGALVPHATNLDVALLDVAPISGHWGWRENITAANGKAYSGWESYGICMVSNPGAPLQGVTASMGQGGRVSYFGSDPTKDEPMKIGDNFYSMADGKLVETETPADVTAAVSNYGGKKDLLGTALDLALKPAFDYVYVTDFTDADVFFSVEKKVMNENPTDDYDYTYLHYTLGLAYTLDGDVPVFEGDPYSVVSTYEKVDVTAAAATKEKKADVDERTLSDALAKIDQLEEFIVGNFSKELDDAALSLPEAETATD